MPKFLFANTASTTLADPVDVTAGIFRTPAGQGGLFPTPGDGERFALVLRQTGGAVEIVHCWQRVDDELSVLRGREGTAAQEWPTDTPISLRTTAAALNNWAQADVGAMAIDAAHVFGGTDGRDTYFDANPGERIGGVFIQLGAGFQVWDAELATWRTVTPVLRGEQGPLGDVTQEVINARDAAEGYANAALAAVAPTYDPMAPYNFPDVVAGSDGLSYRCMGTEVTGIDPVTDVGGDWKRINFDLATTEQAITGTAPDVVMSPATTNAVIFQPETTLYVRAAPNGNNSNDGTSWATAFLTIQHAIDSLAKNLEGTVTIRVGPGDYSGEGTLYISGFSGGSLRIRAFDGSAEITAVNTDYKVDNFNIHGCSSVDLYSFQCLQSTGTIAVYAQGCPLVEQYYMNALASADYGMYYFGASGVVFDSVISNKTTSAIRSTFGQVTSRNNSGTGSVVGLQASSGIILKHSTQPAGTTAEQESNGGKILS